MGFLASPDLLLRDCELKLSLDRLPSKVAVLKVDDVSSSIEDVLTIKDCFATVEYISSPEIRRKFESINTTPFLYEYDDVDVLIKNIPKGETEIRFDNLRGGSIPDYIFIGLIPQIHLQGDILKSSTGFLANNVEEMNLTYNGNSVNGYPISIRQNSVYYPMHKFFDVTDQLYNLKCGSTLNAPEFHYNFIWAHKFEAQQSNGWIGINFKYSEIPKKSDGTEEPMAVVAWIVCHSAFTVDKFMQIEKLNL